jgi:hypothetical protein
MGVDGMRAPGVVGLVRIPHGCCWLAVGKQNMVVVETRACARAKVHIYIYTNI